VKCARVRVACLAGVSLAVVVGCSAGHSPTRSAQVAPTSPVAAATPSAPRSGPAGSAVLPPVPTPGTAAECPYLPSRAAADLDGQLIATVRLDPAYDPPACFFLIGYGSVQPSV